MSHIKNQSAAQRGEEAPPVYTEYPTQLPDTFPIGSRKVQPLVNVTELQAHLTILGAIHKLRTNVQAQEDGVAATNKDLAWVVFVNRAVHRFFIWASSPTLGQGAPGISEDMIPPLDVLMVWHSYLLNPRAYYEDSKRMNTSYTANLSRLDSMPLTLVARLIDSNTLESVPPTDERQASFRRATGQTFECPLVTDFSDVVSVECPRCMSMNHLVKWVAPEEKGYAQINFSHTCDSCNRPFNKEAIGIRKFAEEVTSRRTGQKIYISETLLDPRTGVVDAKNADAFINKFFPTLDKFDGVLQPCTPQEVPKEATKLANRLRYSHKQLSDYLHYSIRPIARMNEPVLPRVQRVTVAYSIAGLASLDLVGAILRQGSFVENMVGLGWTQADRFQHTQDMAPLVRCIARYHAFLDLMCQNPATFLVPTLDIDLAWHTHQLKGAAYRADTLTLLSRTPNHDDSVDQGALSTGYDITAKLWRARFGVPYSVCGCIPDPDAESRLSKITSKFSSFGKKDKISEKDADALAAGPVNNRMDLVSTEDDEADSSHPSEHNVTFGNPADPMAKVKQAARERKTAKCVANAKRSAAKDPWRALQAQRNEKRAMDQQHRDAFTNPYYGYGYYYPYWGVSMAIPFGFYGGCGYAGAVGGCGGGCGAAGCGGGCGGGGGGCGGGCGGGGCGGGG